MMRMNFVRSIFLAVVLAGSGLISCVDHAADNEAEIEQARLDSIVQADTDNDLIDAYIADAANGIDESQVVIGDNGVRHIVWNPATTARVPDFKEIVSVHYVGKFLSNEIFDTTNASRAKDSDSLNYVSEGIVFDNLLAASEKYYEELLDSLNASTGAISDPVFSLTRTYIPMVFNHTRDGSGINFQFISGFKTGLRDVMLKMELNSTALIMIPSAVAYGTIGTVNSDGTESIPPNTPLLFEFSLVNIRP
ncbi:FKBP-type peptidyl-prolyl cis-trans isomerase [Reichenbachiella sp.]|uniref:FKBP-type peptidyl-prolyl cis-trans isomerase n=1 Tax=Reichenbachiella sp. TaxID=2184521 RepID=UPI0032985528